MTYASRPQGKEGLDVRGHDGITPPGGAAQSPGFGGGEQARSGSSPRRGGPPRLPAGSCGQMRGEPLNSPNANAGKCAAQKNFVAVFESPPLRYIKQVILLQRVAMISRFLFLSKNPVNLSVFIVFFSILSKFPARSSQLRPRARKIKPDQCGRVYPGRREKGRRPNRAGRSPPIGGGPPLSLFRMTRLHENLSSSLLA